MKKDDKKSLENYLYRSMTDRIILLISTSLILTDELRNLDPSLSRTRITSFAMRCKCIQQLLLPDPSRSALRTLSAFADLYYLNALAISLYIGRIRIFDKNQLYLRSQFRILCFYILLWNNSNSCIDFVNTRVVVLREHINVF